MSEPLGRWSELAAPPPVVFVGGPVEPDSVIGLARLRREAQLEDWGPEVGGYPLVDFHDDPASVADDVEAVRAFAGHAGWTSGQLEAEIATGSWFVIDHEPTDVFTAEPQSLWHAVLARQGGVFRTVTPDPSAN